MKTKYNYLLAFGVAGAVLIQSCDKEVLSSSNDVSGKNELGAAQDSLPVAVVIAGTTDSGFKDGPALQAKFSTIIDVATRSNGEVYIMETSRIRKLKDGIVSTVAGTGVPGYKDGAAKTAQFNDLQSIAVCKDGTVYVIDKGSNSIRRITSNGVVSTYVGGAENKHDRVIKEKIYDLKYVATGDDGTLYFTEKGLLDPDTEEYLYAIRKITPSGVYTTVREERAFAFNTVDEYADLDVRKNGDIYVANYGRNINDILQFAPDGSYIDNVFNMFFVYGPANLTLVGTKEELYFSGRKDVIYAPYPSGDEELGEPKIVAIAGDDLTNGEEEGNDGKNVKGIDAIDNDLYIGYGTQLKKVTLIN